MTMLEERLVSRVDRESVPGCWLWTGSISPKGYGRISVDGRTVAVHRVAYALWIGPIAEGLEIDHVAARGCRSRACINPDHLDAVTHLENLRRKPEWDKEACIRGHRYTRNRTRQRVDGRRERVCDECVSETQGRKWTCPLCSAQVTTRNRSRHVSRMHGERITR